MNDLIVILIVILLAFIVGCISSLTFIPAKWLSDYSEWRKSQDELPDDV